MKKYGIIGKPVQHSLSKEYFDEYFSQNNILAKFTLYELDDLNDFHAFLRTENLNGLLITIPFKEQIFRLPDIKDMSELAAANVISCEQQSPKSIIKAYNCDWSAFQEELLSMNPDKSKMALILGTGGAAKAVAYALKKCNIEFDMVSRQKKEKQITYKELSEKSLSEYSVIINTTPLGMFPLGNQCPDINYSQIEVGSIAFDLIYNPEKTLFLKKCQENECHILNGKGMVLKVYKKALEIWNLS